jgi:hypothetical protein
MIPFRLKAQGNQRRHGGFIRIFCFNNLQAGYPFISCLIAAIAWLTEEIFSNST